MATETSKTNIQLEANAFQQRLNEGAKAAEEADQTTEGKIRLDASNNYFAKQVRDLRRPGYTTDMDGFRDKQANLSFIIANSMAAGQLRREDGLSLQGQLYDNE